MDMLSFPEPLENLIPHLDAITRTVSRLTPKYCAVCNTVIPRIAHSSYSFLVCFF